MTSKPFIKVRQAFNLLLFALKHWRLSDLLLRVATAFRAGGWRAIQRKIAQTESMREFSTVTSGQKSAFNGSRLREFMLPREILDKKACLLKLDESFSVPATDWNTYLTGQFLKRLNSGTGAIASPGPNCCWLIVTMVKSSEASNAAALRTTFQSAVSLNRTEIQIFNVIVVGETSEQTIKEAAADANNLNVTHSRLISEAIARIPGEDLLIFIRAGDILLPEFAYAARQFALCERKLTLIDLYIRDANTIFPLLLPGINVLHAQNCDYFRSRFIARVDDVRAAIATRQDIHPYDIALVILKSIYVEEKWSEVLHVDLPLIEIAESSDNVSVERNRIVAQKPIPVFGIQQVAAPPLSDMKTQAHGSISVVICTKNKGILLQQLVSSILSLQQHLLAEIIIVANRPTNQYSLRFLAELEYHEKVVVLNYDAVFNFSAQSNLGAERATGEFLLFLNDDIVPTSNDWLEKLVAPFVNARVGASGPLLLYPDERLQHAGMYLGYKNVAGHTLRHALLPDEDYMFLATAPRFVSALTGAALLVRSSLFQQLNGFDPAFATYIQDVDLCMRIADIGYDLAFNPSSILIHMESPSIKDIARDNSFHQIRLAEFTAFRERWGDARYFDPFHNRNFSMSDETLRTLV